MGKVSIIAAIAFSFLGYILLGNMQQTSRETDVRQGDYLSSQIARELAIKGRKLILANWIATTGGVIAPPDTIHENGGSISFDPASFSVVGDIIDFKVRGVYNGAVHDIRSRFQFATFAANPIQIKAAKLDLTIDPSAALIGVQSITLDDQALNELEEVLIDELGLGSDLGDFNLGFTALQEDIGEVLTDAGHGGITLSLVQEADRQLYDQQDGMLYPGQVLQTVDNFVSEFPLAQQAMPAGSTFPDQFGLLPDTPSVLRMADDVTIPAYSNTEGQGILVVEGNLIVEDNATFNWNGLIIIKPPASNLNPQIQFIGESNINGSIVVLQETIPNSGHMDVTAFRDMTGAWASPHGVDKHQSHWPWWLFHTHDYTAQEGNGVVFFGPTAADRIHEDHIFFNETLEILDENDHVYLELNNPSNHGRGILQYGLKGKDYTSHPVAAGFDPDEASPGNSYRTKNFKIKDLDRLQLDVTRLSSLKKMWDNTETPYPGCNIWGGVNGAICVVESHTRQDALTLRMYKTGGGPPKRIYEASLYWHRQEVEEEDFEHEMDALVDSLNSNNFGVHLSLGDSTIINIDDAVLHTLSGFSGGLTMGMHNQGTWHRHWEATDPDNPYYAGN